MEWLYVVTVACTSAVRVKVLVVSSAKLCCSGRTSLGSGASRNADYVLEITRLLNP